MFEFKNAETLLFYISYDGEVFTHDMIKESFKEKRILVPTSNKKDFSLTISEIKSWDDLETGSYEILEPKKENIKPIDLEKVDLIIVPGVAFDTNGNRLGHGKGYYDRLLKNLNVIKIGLAFEFQIFEKISVNKHDKAVDIIITEKRIIKCKKK